jgi:hypothetical protein
VITLSRQHTTISLALKLSFQIQYLASYRVRQLQVLSPRGTSSIFQVKKMCKYILSKWRKPAKHIGTVGVLFSDPFFVYPHFPKRFL